MYVPNDFHFDKRDAGSRAFISRPRAYMNIILSSFKCIKTGRQTANSYPNGPRVRLIM